MYVNNFEVVNPVVIIVGTAVGFRVVGTQVGDRVVGVRVGVVVGAGLGIGLGTGVGSSVGYCDGDNVVLTWSIETIKMKRIVVAIII